MVSFALMLSGACSSEVHSVERFLHHRILPGDSVSIPRELEGLGRWPTDVERPTYWVTSGPRDTSPGWRSRIPSFSEPLPDYLPDMVVGDYVVWRRPDPMSVSQGTVEPVEGDVRSGPMKAIHTLGWWGERGEWIAELVVQPNPMTPTDLCVSLVTGEQEHDLGRLLQGRTSFYPGVVEQPHLRHRIWAEGINWAQGKHRLSLSDCSTGGVLDEWNVDAPPTENWLSNDRLGMTWYQNSGLKEWPAPPRGSRGLRRTEDGIQRVNGPPYPRLRQNEAFPLLVIGPVDPSLWNSNTINTVNTPFRRVKAMLDAPGATMVDWNAVASRLGSIDWSTATRTEQPRRVVPEWMGELKEFGVDIVALNGSHVEDAGEDGARWTRMNALGAGLGTMGKGQPYLFEYSLDDAVQRVALLGFEAPGNDEELGYIVSSVTTMARQTDILLVQINMNGSNQSVDTLVDTLAIPGLDGLWFSGTPEWGRIDVRGSGVVLTGVPDWAARTSHVYGGVRWYLGAGGVVRLDLVALDRNERGQWIRATKERAAEWMSHLAANSAKVGTYVRTGDVIATVDVQGHGIQVSPAVEAFDSTVEPLSVGRIEPSVLPARCEGADPKGVAQSLGPNLHLLSAKWVRSESDGHRPFVLRLVWEKNGAGFQLPSGQVELKAAFRGQALRIRHVPCEGSWGFERFEDGQVVVDEVHVWPPKDAMDGESDVWMTVLLDGEVQRTISGDRKVKLGKIRLEK